MYYPRSFPKFIVLGFVLVCAPLVYALVELAMNLDLLAKQSEQAVVQAARVGQASRQVREQTTALLERGLEAGAITARGADRCLRVAWTLADLDASPWPTPDHVAAALEFRDRRAV